MADPNDVVRLTSCLTEVEAVEIAGALNAEGIHAEVSGAITGGFRAEAPSVLWILVRREDAERASEIVEAFRKQASEIDWSDVDVGDPEDQDPSAPSP